MRNSNHREDLILPVAAAVLAGWVASLVMAVGFSQYTSLSITTPLMVMLAGYVFGVTIVRRGTDDDRK